MAELTTTDIITEAFADHEAPFEFANLVLAVECPMYGVEAKAIHPTTRFYVQRVSAPRLMQLIADCAQITDAAQDDHRPPRRTGGRILYALCGADIPIVLDGVHRSWLCEKEYDVVFFDLVEA